VFFEISTRSYLFVQGIYPLTDNSLVPRGTGAAIERRVRLNSNPMPAGGSLKTLLAALRTALLTAFC
jgi:hypothetical protein